MPTSARALTFGNPLIDGSSNGDGAIGIIFVHTDPIPVIPGGEISTWSFFDDDSTNYVTPLLFQHASGSQFTIRGIGVTRHSTGLGIQTYDFAPQAGTGQIADGNFYFGWFDGIYSNGVASSHNQGAIDLNSGSVLVNWGDWHASIPSIGQDYNFQGPGSPSPRQYSFQIEIVPEPSTALLLGLGLAGMAAARRWVS